MHKFFGRRDTLQNLFLDNLFFSAMFYCLIVEEYSLFYPDQNSAMLNDYFKAKGNLVEGE